LTANNSHPFFILGSDDCERCQILSDYLPDVEVIKIPNKSLGLGDTIAKITYRFSIESCEQCKIRRSVLNKVFPYFWNASRLTRQVRNIALSMGCEELPVLMDYKLYKIHNVDDYYPDFTKKYMN